MDAPPPVEPKNYVDRSLNDSKKHNTPTGFLGGCISFVESWNSTSSNFFQSFQEQFGVYSIPVGLLSLSLFGTVVGVSSYRRKRLQLSREIKQSPPSTNFHPTQTSVPPNANGQLTTWDVTKLFLFPATILSSQFYCVWFILRDHYHIEDWSHLVAHLKWMFRVGPIPPQTLQRYASKQSSIQ